MLLQQEALEDAGHALPLDRSVLRVTPEEVALAAAALEARRDAEYRTRESTLPLEEAIDHLGLNATVEELAPEVEALRLERSLKARRDQGQQRSSRATRAFYAGSIAGLLIFVAILSAMLFRTLRPPRNVARPMTTLPIQKLSTIPDNVPVHIDSNSLGKLAKGDATLDEVSADTRDDNTQGAQASTMFNNEWTVFKSNGTLMLRGWATAEWALNVSNGGKGGIFCSRPGWLPVNNLIPIEVPVYRLENQEFARYMADGKTTDTSANGVVMAADITDAVTAVQTLTEQAIVRADENFVQPIFGGVGKSNVDVSVKAGVVHVAGNATNKRLQQLAGDTATKTIKRLHLPYKVANDLVLSQDPQ